MHARKVLLVSALALGAIGSVALVPSNPAPAPVATVAAAADTYSIDPVHSSVIFRIKHMNTAYFYGAFGEIKGTITLDSANPSASTIQAEIPIDSVTTRNEKRDGHLKSPDFFNAAKFPTATFKSTSVTADGDTFKVTGDLTLHGVTKPVTLDLQKTGSMQSPRGEMIGFETTFTINRSDFGISFMPDGLGEEVRITVSIEARKS